MTNRTKRQIDELKRDCSGIFKINIKVPIWKNNSVGICLDGADADNLVEMAIDYKYKKGANKGLLKYPYVYYLKAQSIIANSIKTHTIQGKTIHEVRINTFIQGDLIESEAIAKIEKTRDNISNMLEETKKLLDNKNNPEKKVIVSKSDDIIDQAEHVSDSNEQENNYNNPKNKNNMSKLFDSTDIENIRKQNSERGGAFLKRLEPNVYTLQLQSVEAKQSKKDNSPLLIMHYYLDSNHHTLDVMFKLDGKGSEISRNKFIDHLDSAYGYTLQPSSSIEDVLNQLKQFVTKKCKIAVKHRKRLYELKPKDGGDPEVVIIRQPEYWYSGPEGDDLSFDPTKAVTGLDKTDMQRYIKLEELNGKPPRDLYAEAQEKEANPFKEEVSASIDNEEEVDDNSDLPF